MAEWGWLILGIVAILVIAVAVFPTMLSSKISRQEERQEAERQRGGGNMEFEVCIEFKQTVYHYIYDVSPETALQRLADEIERGEAGPDSHAPFSYLISAYSEDGELSATRKGEVEL